MAITEETKVKYITSNCSVHELEGTVAYYNYQGTRFRVFSNYQDAMAFAEGDTDINIVADLDTEADLDIFLGDSEVCSVCGTVCFPDDECYEDSESGDACCTECCFYDESNDMYHKGTIEEAYYAALVKLEAPLFVIQQYNQHFNSLCAEFGIFKERDEAISAMMEGFEKLYPGFKEDVYFDGKNYWQTDKYDFVVTIKECSANNTFGEL